MIAQISVALLLTIPAALLTRTFVHLRSIDPGFRTAGVNTMHLAIPRAKYPEDRQVAALCQDIVERVRKLPGVRAAGMVNRLPLGGVAQTIGVELDRSAVPNNRVPSVDSRSVTPEYFSALGIPLLEGRGFTDADTADRLAVGIVDERLARIAWPNESPIGHRFRIPFPGLPWVTIVGVAGHIRHDGFTMDPRPQVYWSYLQRPQDRWRWSCALTATRRLSSARSWPRFVLPIPIKRFMTCGRWRPLSIGQPVSSGSPRPS